MTNKPPRHTAADLAQMQSLPLEAKVRMTLNRLRAWYEHWDGEVYVSFSGGKDSTVLKHLAEQIDPNIPSVFVNTGLEYPEVRQFALRQPNVTRLDPRMKFYDVIEKYGYPVVSKENSQKIYEIRTTKSEALRNSRLCDTRKALPQKWRYLIDAPFKISNKCCDVMKKAPIKAYEKETGRKAIVGTMTHESRLRREAWMQHGCNSFDAKRPISQPMSFWTEQDVLRYIKLNGLEIATVYGDIVEENGHLRLTGYRRTGCMFCMYGLDHDGTPNRFQKMAHTHTRQYVYYIDTLGLGKVLSFMGVDYDPPRQGTLFPPEDSTD